MNFIIDKMLYSNRNVIFAFLRMNGRKTPKSRQNNYHAEISNLIGKILISCPFVDSSNDYSEQTFAMGL